MYKKIKIFFFNIFQVLLKISPSKISCDLNNLRQRFMGRDIIFFYDKKLNLYKVKSDNLTMYFSNKMRGFNTYAYGIKNRATSLAETYSLEKLKIFNDEVVIDCGANFGDLYAWTLVKKLNVKYIAFEPSPREFECIKLNCAGKKNNNIALSNKTGVTEFYLKSSSGDSSIIEPASGFTKKIDIRSVKLEDYVLINNIEKIKFFKLEAEGFEPEILEGSKKILNRIEYIGVDGSPERGKNKDWTINTVKKFLLKNGFNLIAIKSSNFYAKGLFKNKNCNESK